jgi:hypothetical protein
MIEAISVFLKYSKVWEAVEVNPIAAEHEKQRPKS